MVSLQKLDLGVELSEARVSRYHSWLGVIIGILVFFDGYDTFSPAYVIHYVKGPWGLSGGQVGFLVSSGLVGFMIGGLVHGTIADRFGRRITLIGGLWIVSIFTLSTALFADDFGSFCTLRFLAGLGLGVLLPLATTYMNELAPKRVVNRFAIWGVAFGWALGGAVASIAGVLVTPYYGWHSLYWLGGLSFLVIPVVHYCLPESPGFLLLHARYDELKQLLARLRPERAGLYRSVTLEHQAGKARKTSVMELFSPQYRKVTIALWISAFLGLFCVYGLSAWIPTIMMERKETFSASFAFGALMQIASFLGSLMCSYFMDRSGNGRKWLAAWWIAGGFAVIVLVYFNSHFMNMICIAAAGFFTIGAQLVLNNFTAASYETHIRATGVGMELGVGRLGAIAGPYVAGIIQQFYSGAEGVFWVIGIASIAAALMIMNVQTLQKQMVVGSRNGTGQDALV